MINTVPQLQTATMAEKNCPVRRLAEHRNCLVLHAPLQCFYFFAFDGTGYTQSDYCGLSARAATLRPREFAENFV